MGPRPLGDGDLVDGHVGHQFRVQGVRLFTDHQAQQDVPQFTHIARPMIHLKERHQIVDRGRGATQAVVAAVAFHQVLHQRIGKA